jgi:hypothetical protein
LVDHIIAFLFGSVEFLIQKIMEEKKPENYKDDKQFDKDDDP